MRVNKATGRKRCSVVRRSSVRCSAVECGGAVECGATRVLGRVAGGFGRVFRFVQSGEDARREMRNAGVFWRNEASAGIWRWGQATLAGFSVGELPEGDGTRCGLSLRFFFFFPQPCRPHRRGKWVRSVVGISLATSTSFFLSPSLLSLSLFVFPSLSLCAEKDRATSRRVRKVRPPLCQVEKNGGGEWSVEREAGVPSEERQPP